MSELLISSTYILGENVKWLVCLELQFGKQFIRWLIKDTYALYLIQRKQKHCCERDESKTLVTVGARHPLIRMDDSLLVCSFISTHCLSLLSWGKRAQAWGLLIFHFKNKPKPKPNENKQTNENIKERKDFQTMEINSYSNWPAWKSVPWSGTL